MRALWPDGRRTLPFEPLALQEATQHRADAQQPLRVHVGLALRVAARGRVRVDLLAQAGDLLLVARARGRRLDQLLQLLQLRALDLQLVLHQLLLRAQLLDAARRVALLVLQPLELEARARVLSQRGLELAVGGHELLDLLHGGGVAAAAQRHARQRKLGVDVPLRALLLQPLELARLLALLRLERREPRLRRLRRLPRAVALAPRLGQLHLGGPPSALRRLTPAPLDQELLSYGQLRLERLSLFGGLVVGRAASINLRGIRLVRPSGHAVVSLHHLYM